MKQTPIQKAIKFTQDIYTPTIAEPMINYLQSLLGEERQMVEDAVWYGHDNRPEMIHVPETFASDYFTQTYEL